MQERDTDDLQQKLLEASDLDRFMEENNDSFVSEDMAELLLKMLQKELQNNYNKICLSYKKSALKKADFLFGIYFF